MKNGGKNKCVAFIILFRVYSTEYLNIFNINIVSLSLLIDLE